MSQYILLDPNIRNWVLLPLIGILLFVNIIRHYAGLLIMSSPKPNMVKIVNSNIANYARMMLSIGNMLPSESFRARVTQLLEKDLKKSVEPPNPMDMMGDTSVMTNMLKNQFMSFVPQIGMMMLISYFFSGFVVAQFPFALSPRLRGMAQRGLEIDDLDGNYVTSLSMFFIIMAGSQGLLSLLLGQNVSNMSEQAIMLQQMTEGTNAAAPENFQQIYKALTTELEFIKDRHRWSLTDTPDLLLREWRAKKKLLARAHRAK